MNQRQEKGGELVQECIFCKIVRKEIPADIIYEDNEVIILRDIRPVAPVHLLLIPKKHIPTFFDLKEEDAPIINKLHLAGAKIAEKLGYKDKGFRLVSNCQSDAGQLIFHVHYHLITGRPLHWPPG